MVILLLGAGGREHALAWALSKSPLCERLLVMPGNPGIVQLPKTECVKGDPLDFGAVANLCAWEEVGLVVVGPEEPLVRGLREALEADPRLAGLAIIGPGKEGAMLEGSKAFSKGFMQRNGIPTAAYQAFTKGQESEAVEFLETLSAPYVIKASGLAAGKGVIIVESPTEAEQAVREMLSGEAFGAAGDEVVIEQFLTGIECSVFALTDGKNYALLPVAKDYKRVGEGDTGPNTGGMGSVSPVPFVDEFTLQTIKTKIIEPTLEGLDKEGIPFVGFLFFGLMMVDEADGLDTLEPYLIEYNTRMGDPETQVVMPRLAEDLVELCLGAADGSLVTHDCAELEGHAVCVVATSAGYPGPYAKAIPFEDLAEWDGENTFVFHAGTAQGVDGKLATNGGRVAAHVALGASLEAARNGAYDLLERTSFEGMQIRRDIGLDMIAFEKNQGV